MKWIEKVAGMLRVGVLMLLLAAGGMGTASAAAAVLRDTLAADEDATVRYVRMENAGKMLVCTGAGLMLGSAVDIWHIDRLADRYGERFVVGYVSDAAVCALGAVVALIGTPLWIAGAKCGSGRPGSIEIGGDGQKGFSAFIEFGVMTYYLRTGVTGGWHFSENLFAGAGIGTLFIDTLDIVPVFAEVRYTIGDSRYAPYIALDAGYDVRNNGLFSEFTLGTRVRTGGSEHRNSWWLGGSTVYINNAVLTRPEGAFLVGVKAAYSF